MRTEAETMLEPAIDPRQDASPALSPTRPLYWSVRRELWENRSIYLAPLGVGAFAVVALVIHGITMPSHLPGMLAIDPEEPGSASFTYTFAAMLMLTTAFAVGVFYCLDALSGERRDRSILFWKSLPVSDLTVVLSKAIVPLVVLPLITFVAIVAMQLAMLLLSSAALLVYGRSVAALWNELQLLRMWPALLYALVAISLWHAPIYAFLLLMSGWARRAAVLWAVLPLLAVGVLEKLTMDTLHTASATTYRLVGWYAEAFSGPTGVGVSFDLLASLTPGRFLGAPALWAGLAFAAVCLAAAVRLRRYRDPI